MRDNHGVDQHYLEAYLTAKLPTCQKYRHVSQNDYICTRGLVTMAHVSHSPAVSLKIAVLSQGLVSIPTLALCLTPWTAKGSPRRLVPESLLCEEVTLTNN